MSSKLNTTNPDHITYLHPPLDIAVLGGIKLEGLDRMRVTLKLQVEHLSLRHNLDLYNDNQTEKLIRKVAERMEIGTIVTVAALNDLTDQLEQYRLEEIEKAESQQEVKKHLTEQEIKEARTYLAAPNLMERTKEDIGKAGVIGEENNRLLMYLIFTSRKRENPLHIVSLGSSGIGKTHLQEKVGALIPEEDKLEITTLSENAFYYFGKRQLQNKLLLIEDLDGAEGVLYPLRELQSKKRIHKTVVHKNTKGETRSINLTVEGPVSVAGCTTKENLYEDNANRSFLIYINESAEQDQKIMHYQRRLSAGKVDTTEERNVQEKFKNMQRILKPVQVRNPFAEHLHIPQEIFKPRRTNAHYLAFIEAVTFYHQYQREKQYDKETGEEYIATSLEDIIQANELLKEVLLRKSDPLTGACRNYFEKLKLWAKQEERTRFTNQEISRSFRIPVSTIKRYHLQLLNSEYLKAEGKKYLGFKYEIINFEEYEQLKSGISSVMDQVIDNLPSNPKRLSGSPVAYQPTEPPKSKRISKKDKAAQ